MHRQIHSVIKIKAQLLKINHSESYHISALGWTACWFLWLSWFCLRISDFYMKELISEGYGSAVSSKQPE